MISYTILCSLFSVVSSQLLSEFGSLVKNQDSKFHVVCWRIHAGLDYSISLYSIISLYLLQGYYSSSRYLNLFLLLYFGKPGTGSSQSNLLSQAFSISFKVSYHFRLLWHTARAQSDVKFNSCLTPVSAGLPKYCVICISPH